MTEEPFKQRIHRLLEEKNVKALLILSQQLLDSYIDGNDNLDLEPIISTQYILKFIINLLSQTQRKEETNGTV